MTLTTHTAMGAFIGSLTGNPVIAFIGGFVSHLLVDMIPHGDSKLADNFRVHKIKRKQAVAYPAIDAVVAILFILFLISSKDISSMRTFAWGIAGAVLPDLLVGLSDLIKIPILKKFYKFHFFFHDFVINRKGDVPLKYALAGQIVFISLLTTQI